MLSREQLAALVGVRLDGLFKRAPRAQRRRDHRYARQLGGALDHVGHARRRDGGLSQSHLPAGGSRPARRSGGRGQPRPVADCRGEAGARRLVAGAKRQFADVPPAHLAIRRRPSPSKPA